MRAGKDAISNLKKLAGAIASAVCLFSAPSAHAHGCANNLSDFIQLNVPGNPKQITRDLKRYDPKVVAGLPELPTVLLEVVKVARERRAALSVWLHKDTVRFSLDLPPEATDLPVQRLAEKANTPQGEDVPTVRYDITVSPERVLVSSAEAVARKTPRAVFVPEAGAGHSWGLAIQDPPDETIVIDTLAMPVGLYLGERSQPLYRGALKMAARLAHVLAPNDRVVLKSPRATLLERQGEWEPLPAAR